jgi:hypothetical protein
MANVKKKFRGYHTHRFKNDPLEKQFALAWQNKNDRRQGQPYGLMDYLFDPDNKGIPYPALTERDWEVSSTLIQWLGSQVGQFFLAEALSGKDAEYFRDRLVDALSVGDANKMTEALKKRGSR